MKNDKIKIISNNINEILIIYRNKGCTPAKYKFQSFSQVAKYKRNLKMTDHLHQHLTITTLINHLIISGVA